MSKPSNVLGKFSSYAYHHILMVTATTEAAEALSNTSEVTTFQHSRSEKRYAPRSLNGKKNQYITLIDGTADARFFITSASWENVIAMEDFIGDGNIPQSTSMSLEGELKIIEPLGAKFLNELINVCNSLGTDPVGLQFVLKTIFVGHSDDGTTEMISNIKPLLFICYDITAVFDSSGAQYKMAFIGAVNGLTKLPHTQQIANGFQYKVDSNNTLERTLGDIGDKLTAAYDGFKNKAMSDFAKTQYDSFRKEGRLIETPENVSKSRKFFTDNYRNVKYEIFATDYSDKKYKAGDNDNVRIENEIKDGSYNFGNNVGIETIIKKIMASSTGVINDGKADKDGKRYIYKIMSGIKSTDREFIVQYYVNKYEMLMLPYEAAFEGKEFTPVAGQSIEFDYIFTGKNVDIKELDIKMEMGMAFFQLATTTESLPTQSNIKDGATSTSFKGTGSIAPASDNKVDRTKTPLFFGSKMQNRMARNTKRPADSASFQALLSRHAALESIETVMTIYGNPKLLGEMLVVPSDLIKLQKQEKGDVEESKENKTINPNWGKVPTLVKVKIKMPVDNNDVNTEYENFWYTGYYTLFAVKQLFEDGEFTQELDMLSLPVSDIFEDSTDEKKPNAIKKDKARDEAAYRKIEAAFKVPSEAVNNKKTVGQVTKQDLASDEEIGGA